jgi:hypothetical protein
MSFSLAYLFVRLLNRASALFGEVVINCEVSQLYVAISEVILITEVILKVCNISGTAYASVAIAV